MTDQMKVISISVKDVLGAREFAMEPGKINTIHGRNGSGKTSALTAIQSAIGGGKLANLSRVQTEAEAVEDEQVAPEVVLVLEGEDGRQFRVEKNADKTRVRAQIDDSAAFEDVPSPQRWLDGLFDGRMSNPIRFLEASEKDRVLILLGALDLDFDRAGLWSRMELLPEEIAPVPEGLHPLQEIALIREGIFRERTGVNRDQKGKAQSAEQLLREIPAKTPEDLNTEIAAIEEAVAGMSGTIERGQAEAEGLFKNSEVRIEAEREAKKARIDTAASEKIQEINEKFEQQIAELRETQRRDVALVEDLAEADKKAVDSQARTEEEKALNDRDVALRSFEEASAILAAKREELAELRGRQEGVVKAQALRTQADQFQADADELKGRSEKLTAAIRTLDQYRAELADNLPIKGLEIQGDGKKSKLLVGGVEFDQLNTAQQIEIAVKVACIRAKKQRLPVVCVDGAERMDAVNFAALKAALDSENVQAFIARVSDEDLKVEAE
jgi:DNA repair exonuclease SbcCD ATPase subunit